MLKAEHAFFDLTPRVVPADRPSRITIKPLYGHVAFPADPRQLRVQYNRRDGGPAQRLDFVDQPYRIVDGALSLELNFRGEGEHMILVSYLNEDGSTREFFRFRVYSLFEDYFVLRPFKGDFHLHSMRSDGQGTPGYMAARCRQIGFDFMALTDHHRYQPSLEAIAEMGKFDLDFRCYPGEEVHPPDNCTHIINFGSSFSVNDIFREEPDRYRREVKAYAEALSEVPEAIRQPLASSHWVFDQIRSGGGLAVFCHPYWEYAGGYYISEELTTETFKYRKFDALELIGGYNPFEYESNMMQVARYEHELAAGNRFPVVGLSDSHGPDGNLFGWYYTVMLAPSVELPDLATAVREFRAVAVDAPNGERFGIHGDFRLVKFVSYLLREFYPLHDQLCALEGALLIRALAGDTKAAAEVDALKGSVPDFVERCWGRAAQAI